MFTAAEKTLLYIIIVIFAENASLKSYGVICFPRMPLTSYSGATNYGYQWNPRNVGMTLLFAVLTKNNSFRSYSTFVYLLRAHILNINTCSYPTIIYIPANFLKKIFLDMEPIFRDFLDFSGTLDSCVPLECSLNRVCVLLECSLNRV